MHASESESRWVGAARADDPAAAVAAALRGRDPELVVVFAPSRLGDLDTGCPTIGCTTVADHAEAFALGGPGFAVAAAHSTAPPRDAGAEAAACVGSLAPRPHRVLVALSAGHGGDQQDVVRGAYSVAGASVPLVGGSAGGHPVVHGGTVIPEGVAMAAIASDAPFGIGVRHGWRAVGDGLIITASSGTVVETIDDRPALDVYVERLSVPPEVAADRELMAAFGLTHPLAIPTRGAEPQLRLVVDADVERRTFRCTSQMPPGTVAWPTVGDSGSVLEATRGACGEAVAALGGRRPLALLAFDCHARRAVLGDDGTALEQELLSESAGGAPVAGFHSYGEFARVRGLAGFHNQALAVLAVA